MKVDKMKHLFLHFLHLYHKHLFSVLLYELQADVLLWIKM